MFHQAKGYNYGFVEYDDPGAAERAMQTLNGRRVHQMVRLMEIRHALALDTATNRSIGDPCQLGLSVQHVQQGGHLEPFPYLRGRLVERGQR